MKKKRQGKTPQEETPNLFGSKLDLERLEAKFGWKPGDVTILTEEEWLKAVRERRKQEEERKRRRKEEENSQKKSKGSQE